MFSKYYLFKQVILCDSRQYNCNFSILLINAHLIAKQDDTSIQDPIQKDFYNFHIWIKIKTLSTNKSAIFTKLVSSFTIKLKWNFSLVCLV